MKNNTKGAGSTLKLNLNPTAMMSLPRDEYESLLEREVKKIKSQLAAGKKNVEMNLY